MPVLGSGGVSSLTRPSSRAFTLPRAMGARATFPKRDAPRLVRALREADFEDVHTDDRVEENFVMGHPERGLIDFHIFVETTDGGGVYRPRSVDWRMSARELGAQGLIGGRAVRCMPPAYHVRSHAGYTLQASDVHDLSALQEAFGVRLSTEQSTAIEARRR